MFGFLVAQVASADSKSVKLAATTNAKLCHS